MKKDKYEIIIPERRYIVIGLEEAGRNLYKTFEREGFIIK